jgi:protein gp37
MENTRIEWCDHTINFWWGCTKVSPACLNCYAQKRDAHLHPSVPMEYRFQNERSQAAHWGPNAPRWMRVEAAVAEAMKLAHKAAGGPRPRVFASSMSDLFEDRPDLDEARLEAFDTMRQTPGMDWLLLTKRPELVMDLIARAKFLAVEKGRDPRWSLTFAWLDAWTNGHAPENVWMGTTVENQEWAEKRLGWLINIPAKVRFLSVEPMLGPIDLDGIWGYPGSAEGEDLERWPIHWVIAGGETKSGSRPPDIRWFRSLRDQCWKARVPFFFKAWGDWAPAMGDLWWNPLPDGPQFMTRAGARDCRALGDGYGAVRLGAKHTGSLLDGCEHKEFPR